MTFNELIRKHLNLAIATIMMMIAASPIFAVGTVTQSLNTLGAQNWVLAINWTGDATTGTVPSTLTTSAQIIQGYRVFAVEISPGSPAPTNLYTVTLTTFLGVDVLGGGGASLSNSAASALQVPATAPPVNGALTFNLSGNSVAGAKGNVLVYFAPIAQVTGLLAPTGPSLTGNNLFSGNTSFSGTSTFSGPINSSNTNTFSAGNTFTGATLTTNLNNCQHVDSSQTLPAAIAAVGNPGCIILDINYVMAASSVIPSTVTLKSDGVGGITTTGFTLTVNGPIVAPPTQLFFGTGTIVMGNGSWPVLANWFPGADMGAQINNTYAALTIPASACTVQTIDIASKTDGSPYAYSTPILLNRTGLLVKLRGTATLNYTPVTATTAITLDYMSAANCPNQHPTAHGIEGIRLINNGGTAPNGGGTSLATGLQLGNTNGAEGATLIGFTADSFSVGISIPGGGVNAFGMVCVDCVIARNVTGISLGTTTETTTITGGRIIVNGTGISYANGDFYINGASIDSNTVIAATGTGNYHSGNNHYENFNTSNCNFINATNGTVTSNGDAFADDTASSTCNWFVHLNGASGSFNGDTVTSAGQTVTQAILVDQPSTAYINLINQNASLITVSGGSSTVQSVVDTTQGKSSDPVHQSAFGQGIIIGPTANAVSTGSRNVSFQGLNSVGVVETSSLNVGVNTANRTYTLPDNTGGLAVIQTGDNIFGTYRVTTDQTITAGASLTNIPGLSWTFPVNTALNVKFSCDILYSQATAAASDSFGFQDVTVAPTNAESYGRADTSATAFTAANTDAAGVTTAVTVVTFTPSAATTIFGAHIDGLIEQPSNASTSVFNIMAQFTTNNGTIKRGSSCQVF